ncbi:MAG: nucleotide exchange factor GrpE [Robiginitomaculum sp.]
MTDKKDAANDAGKALPTDAELDALQAQIDDALAGSAKRKDAPDAETPEEAAPEGPSAAERITELEAEVAAMKDKALRAMADADNVKKRAEREVVASRIYAVERFAVDMLSVSDNLGRALLGLDDKAKDEMGANAKSLLDGIELTEKELMAVFARHGIKAVAGVGSKFDPNVHQAVAQIPSSELKGDVATVMQTGFTLGDRTLRAAMVAVSTGKA